MAELFGEEGVALCKTIETRMRRHVSPEEKAARVKNATLAPTSPFAAPSAPQPFSYRTVFGQPA